MNSIKVIITGTTGMAGEGVLLACLNNPQVTEVLSLSRRPISHQHPKLKTYIVQDFLSIQSNDPMLQGYDACFFCAGISSIGMNESKYTQITYDTTLHVARAIANPQMSFVYISGAYTDGTEKGKIMWARVKGKTENDLAKLSFQHTYAFRPGFMKAMPDQKHLLTLYKYFAWLYPILKVLAKNTASTIQDVANAMVYCVTHQVEQRVIEVADINRMGKLS